MAIKLGLQMWSVRDNFAKDYVATLEQIAKIGYTNIQVNSFDIKPEGMYFGDNLRAPELREQLDRFGLRAVSAHFAPTPEMRVETVVEDLRVLGADTLACAIGFWSNREQLLDWIKEFNDYNKAFKELGIQLYYHNHFHEFQVFGDKSIFELMIENFDPDIKFEFDTYWSVRGGQDPIYWLKKLGSRADLIHQKDMPATTSPVILFEKVGYDADINMQSMWETQDASHFTEVGQGVLNVPAILEATRRYNNPDYIFIEQDMSSLTEMESIEVSYKYFSKLLAGK